MTSFQILLTFDKEVEAVPQFDAGRCIVAGGRGGGGGRDGAPSSGESGSVPSDPASASAVSRRNREGNRPKRLERHGLVAAVVAPQSRPAWEGRKWVKASFL